MASKRTKNIALSILIATSIGGVLFIVVYLMVKYTLAQYLVLGLVFVFLVYSEFRILDSRPDKPDTR